MFNTIGTSIKVRVLNPDGSCVYEKEEESKSLLRAFSRTMWAIFKSASYTLVGIDGTTEDITKPFDATDSWLLILTAVASNDDRGIVIGRGDTAVALDDYCLETLIVEGTSTNQMNYLLQTESTVEGASEDYTELKRVITNNSGATIVVKEAGVHAYFKDDMAVDKYCLIMRDILSSEANVLQGQSIEVTYKIKTVL